MHRGQLSRGARAAHRQAWHARDRSCHGDVPPAKVRFYATLSSFLRLPVLILPALVQAQQPEKPKFLVKIDQVRVGFRGYQANDGAGQFKVGMWAPVYVDITAGPKGVPAKNPPPFLEFECGDSE